MKVEKWMKHPVCSVKPLDSVLHARELMEKHRVNQLPVVVDGRLVGIVTDRDLRDAFPSVFDPRTSTRRKPRVTAADPQAVEVEMAMSPNVLTIGPDCSMGKACQLMRRERIGALPVVDGERLVGIVTRSDMLAYLIEITAKEEKIE